MIKRLCLITGLLCGGLGLLFVLVTAGYAQETKMKTKKDSPTRIPLWEGKPPASAPEDSFIPTLEPHLLPGDQVRGAVIVLPGGGYGGRAEHERTPIAQFFNDKGFHTFILDYRVSPNRHPAPLLDVCRAVRMVRSRAEEWKVKPDKIATLGFSAGGHLTGCSGVFYDLNELKGIDPQESVSARPDAIVLCYPVILAGPLGHKGSFDNLLGENATEEIRARFSLDKQVRPDMPPAFLWHTFADQGVPVENSLRFALAMKENKVPFEMHIYPDGAHGLGLAPKDSHVATWAPLCAEWLKKQGW